MADDLAGQRQHREELRAAFREFFKTPDDRLFEQNGITVVLPPKSAERVPDSKSSAMTMPSPDGCEM